jgi:hypothetical protein
MPITFQCPNCSRRMTVKDEYAGKRGACSGCKASIIVPYTNGTATLAQPATNGPAPPKAPAKTNPTAPAKAPKPRAAVGAPTGDGAVKAARPGAPPPPPTKDEPPPPPVDADAEAMSVFSDEPKKKEETPTSIKFTCEFCDYAIELPMEDAGKRLACPNPECRRIVKVPNPTAKVEKKDWLKSAQPTEPEPAGAWGVGGKAAEVSEKALEEAGAIEKEPLTRIQKMMWGILYAYAAFLALWITLNIRSWWTTRTERQAIEVALTFAKDPKKAATIRNEGTAALHLAAGDYFQRTQKGEPAKNARDQFRQALDKLGSATDATECDALRTDIALALLELGGTEKEIEAGTRLEWDKVQLDVRQAIGAIGSDDARLDALRLVTRRLIDRGQAERALDLGKTFPGPRKAEAIAVVGLELFSAGKKELAEKAAHQCFQADTPAIPLEGEEQPQVPKKDPAAGPEMPSSVAALALLLERKPTGYENNDPKLNHVGMAEADARKGEWNKARSQLNNLGQEPIKQLRGHLTLGTIATDPKEDAEAAVKLAESLVQRPDPNEPRLVYRAVELGARAGLDEARLMALAARTGDTALKGRAQLAVLREKLARSGKAGDVEELKVLDKDSQWSRLGRQMLARHNARLDSSFAKTVQTWDDADKAFGSAGLAIGLRGDDERDKKK